MKVLQERVIPVLVVGYSVIVLVCFLVLPLLFIQTVRLPFMGAFYEHTLMINTTSPTIPGAWDKGLGREGLQFGYQIYAINGERVYRTSQMSGVLGQYQPGEQVTITLLAPEGALQDYTVELIRLPFSDQLSYFIIPYLTGLIYLASGLYVFGIRRNDPAGRAFGLFTAATAMGLGGLYDIYSTNYLTVLWTISLAVSGGALFNLAMLFPESVRQVREYPFLRWLGYIPAIIVAAIAVPTIYNMAHPTAYVLAWRFEFIFLGVSAFLFIGFIVLRRYTSVSPVVREQARLMAVGALLSFTLLAIWFFATTINQSFGLSSWYMLPMGFFPVFTGYAIIRYRLLSTDYILSRMALYMALTAIAVIGYALLVSGLSQIFVGVLDPNGPLMIGLLVFALALGLNPLRLVLQRRIDEFFFRSQFAYRERLQAFGRELTQAMDLNKILSVLRQYIESAFLPTRLHLFVYDLSSGHYLAMPDDTGRPTSDVRFAVDSALVQVLARQREAFFLSDLGDAPATVQADQARLALLGAQLYVPLPGQTQLIGWIALGGRRSGEPYNTRDLGFLESLSDQAALAIERTQVISDLERRVREMNVLTLIAQGVSFTVGFDDILELLSAQADQLLPARDFHVTLFDQETGMLSHAFYLEDDERLTEREALPLPAGQGLEWEVINSHRYIITDDYERECRGRGLLPRLQGVYAWIGVPMNAGAETIGLISVASRDPAITYTEEQRNLLQAIADQASGAIVKARLLEESERRARQLAQLNEIGLGLTSTLDISLLLNQIMQSAVEILNCEAGSLFLVDQETDELVFEVVTGPVASNLLGRRLPPGTGLVGEAVQTGRALIVNDAKRRKEWFEKTDEQTGFTTQDLLAVPMRVQDRVIGVIEVINKRNGAPFTQADQDLLTAYTSQASIAVENARLYTMTDQALADRVEELSVMQRIDRELNASLDIERAMRITLDWAMRQSEAQAGLVGMVEPEGVRVMVAQGYADEVTLPGPADNGNHQYLPADLLGVSEAIQSGQPQRRRLADGAMGVKVGLLKGAGAQIVIPIRRETESIGVILLESMQVEQYPDELVGFLARLSDHAAIAIANAQLFDEVNEANLAKSRFVSFVAHELKNPMASIKGYTELVAGGMAGPINEMQTSFLATVRSNVDRMNTIVSDLNDLTKIQVGNLRLDFRTVQAPEVVDEVVRSLKRQIDEKEQQVNINLPSDLPTVWADPARLNQIIVNLVSNAVKYTPQNGAFTVGAERYTSEDETLAGVQFVRIWVEDTGIGISEEDQKQIFQQYFRTENAKEMASGTGLGLNITKSLIEMQGGKIWFESQVGQGTIFHFTVPVAETQ
ncbi:MAG: GAF domain-containing protein [Chloroflexota bacterium]